MQFRKYLQEKSIFLDKEFDTLDGVLHFLAKEFATLSDLSEQEFYTHLKEREKLGSTYIGNNTLLPHNHLKEIKHLQIIFIRCQKPLILDSGEEVRYIFSIMTPTEDEQLYLSILRGISRLILEHREDLEACQSKAGVFSLFESCDCLAGKPLKASDIASSWPTVDKSAKLSDALDLMKTHGVFFLPVRDKNGAICGILDLLDLLKAGFPDYVFSLYDLSMIQDFQPVKYFWTKEADLPIGDFIRDYRNHIIRDEATYPEIFFLMIKGNRRHLIVLDKSNEFLGVISPNRIINTMLRP